MKKYITFMLCLAMIFSSFSCGVNNQLPAETTISSTSGSESQTTQETSASSTSEAEDQTASQDTLLPIYEDVLNNRIQVFDTYRGTLSYFWDMRTPYMGIPLNQVSNFEYAYTDIGNDQIKELIIKCGGDTLILRAYDYKVYVYPFTFRQLDDLQANGAYSWNHQGQDFEYGESQLIFNGTKIQEKELWRVVNDGTPNAEYYIDNQQVTSDELSQYLSDYNEIPMNFAPLEIEKYKIDDMKYFSSYESILDLYRVGIENFDIINDITKGAEFENELFGTEPSKEKEWFSKIMSSSFLLYPGRKKDDPFSSKHKASCGYVIKDLNNDGVDELILINNDYYSVIAIFSMANGKPVLLGNYWHRHTCWIDEKGRLHVTGSSGADYTSHSIYSISAGGESLVLLKEFGVDGCVWIDDVSHTKYYQFDSLSGGNVEITESEFDALYQFWSSDLLTKYKDAAEANKKYFESYFTPLFTELESEENMDASSKNKYQFFNDLIAENPYDKWLNNELAKGERAEKVIYAEYLAFWKDELLHTVEDGKSFFKEEEEYTQWKDHILQWLESSQEILKLEMNMMYYSLAQLEVIIPYCEMIRQKAIDTKEFIYLYQFYNESLSYADFKIDWCCEPENTTVTTTVAPNQYAAIINMYKEIVHTHKNPTESTIDSNRFSQEWYEEIYGATLIGNVSENVYGYAFCDLNGDKESELVLLLNDYTILSIFSMVDGEPVMLDDFHSRKTCWINQDKIIHVSGSNGADRWSYSEYTLSEDGTKLNLIFEYGSEGYDSINNKNNYYMISNSDKVSISQEKFDELCSSKPYTSMAEAAKKTKDHNLLEFISLSN